MNEGGGPLIRLAERSEGEITSPFLASNSAVPIECWALGFGIVMLFNCGDLYHDGEAIAW